MFVLSQTFYITSGDNSTFYSSFLFSGCLKSRLINTSRKLSFETLISYLSKLQRINNEAYSAMCNALPELIKSKSSLKTRYNVNTNEHLAKIPANTLKEWQNSQTKKIGDFMKTSQPKSNEEKLKKHISSKLKPILSKLELSVFPGSSKDMISTLINPKNKEEITKHLKQVRQSVSMLFKNKKNWTDEDKIQLARLRVQMLLLDGISKGSFRIQKAHKDAFTALNLDDFEKKILEIDVELKKVTKTNDHVGFADLIIEDTDDWQTIRNFSKSPGAARQNFFRVKIKPSELFA